MAAATDSTIFLTINNKPLNQQRQKINHCSICGKNLKFDRISDNPLTCWNCMVVMRSSKEGYCCRDISLDERSE
jgi:hypothetical protein